MQTQTTSDHERLHYRYANVLGTSFLVVAVEHHWGTAGDWAAYAMPEELVDPDQHQAQYQSVRQVASHGRKLRAAEATPLFPNLLEERYRR